MHVASSPSTPSESATGGNLTLLDLLAAEYRKTPPPPPIGSSREPFQPEPADSLRAFLRFANAYLAENRPVEAFAVDANIGIRLANLVSVLVAPPLGQDAGSVGTGGAVAITGR